MALVVDTNILLYAVNLGCPEHEFCLDFLRELVATGDTCFVPENVIYRVPACGNPPAIFHSPLRASEAVKFMDAPLSVPNFRVLGATDSHWSSLRALPSGNFFLDVHTAALMREHGIRRIASADKDFAKFSSLEVINPSHLDRI